MWRAGTVAIVLLACFSPGTSVAAPAKSFTIQAKTLELEAGKTTSTRVLNQTAETLRLLWSVQLADGRALPLAPGPDRPASVKVGPASSKRIAVTVPEGVRAGTFSGSLTVWRETPDEVARIPLTLEVVKGADKTLPKPAVKKVTITHTRNLVPWWTSTEHDAIPLDAAVKAGTKLGKLRVAKGDLLGVVAEGGDDVAVVRAGDEVRNLRSGLAALEVDVSGLEGVGAYEGTIDLLPDDEKAGDVALTVRNTDGLLPPVFFLAFGLGAALVARRVIGVLLSTWRLRQAVADVETQLDAGASDRGHAYDISASVRSAASDLDSDVGKIERWAFATPNADRVKTVETKLGSLRAAVDAFATLPTRLAALKVALNDLETWQPPTALPPVPGSNGRPTFAVTATELLVGKTMTVEDFAKASAEIDAAAAAAKLWPAFAADVSKAWALAESIRAKRAALGERAEAFDAVAGRVTGTWRLALEAESAKDLDELKPAAALEEAYAELTTYSDVLAERPRPTRRGFVPLGAAMADIAATALGAVGAPPVVDDRVPARIRRLAYALLRRTVTWVLFFASFAGAVLGGLQALYFGHEFGELRDYLAAFLWGFGATAVISTLVDAAERVRAADAPIELKAKA